MRGKSVGLLVLALGCGLVASIGITRVMAKRNVDAATPAGETETIFVAIEDISAATILTPQMVRMEPWPKDKIPPTALTAVEDIEGRKAKGKIYAGEALLDNKLFAKGASNAGVDVFIPSGYRAVAVKVDMVSGGSNMIRPGSRVDVLLYIAACPAKGIAQTVVKTILQDIKVFAVNDVAEVDSEESDSGKSIKATTISLLLTLDQTQQVILAAELGKIRLVMRSPEQDGNDEVGETTTGDILDESEGNRDSESLVQETPLPSLPTQTGSKPESGGILGKLWSLNNQPTKTTPALQIPAGATEPERHEMRLVIGPEVRHVTLQSSRGEDGTRRWRVSEGNFENSGFALAADAPALDGAPPPGGPAPVDPDDAEENEKDNVPSDDE